MAFGNEDLWRGTLEGVLYPAAGDLVGPCPLWRILRCPHPSDKSLPQQTRGGRYAPGVPAPIIESHTTSMSCSIQGAES